MRYVMRVLFAATLLLAGSHTTSPLAADDAIAKSDGTHQPVSYAEFDRRARAGERLNVVFFGASLTWGANARDPQQSSYRALISQRLQDKYPAAHFRFHDAAIGGTNSQLGVFRLDRDVLRHQPALVFLDFSANDDIGSATPETLASYEALLRRIILDAKCPVIQVIFPFRWNVEFGTLEAMLRRTEHLRLSQLYGTETGDAILEARNRVAEKKVTVTDLWPIDGAHPADDGYALFADVAWQALERGIKSGQPLQVPEKMAFASTYMTIQRVQIGTLGKLPEGWSAGMPHHTSAYYDMLMSRWLDSEVIAKQGAQPLEVNFTGATVLLFGESTPTSGKYQVSIDGKVVTHVPHGQKTAIDDFDAGDLGRRVNGNAHLVQPIAEGLDPAKPHVLTIQPRFEKENEELRLESICVAGGRPSVSLVLPAQKKKKPRDN